MLNRQAFSLLCLLFYLLIDSPCHAQINSRATLSVVFSQGTDLQSIPRSAVLLELQNLSDQPQIILHHRPWRDYVTRNSTPYNSADSLVSQNSLTTPTAERKYSARQSYSIVYHPLYTPLIEDYSGNQQTLIELKISELNDQEIFVSDELVNDRIYGTILKPGQTYRDLKRVPQKAGRYTYTFNPVLISTKRLKNTINVGGQFYQLVLPKEIQSNQLTLLVMDR